MLDLDGTILKNGVDVSRRVRKTLARAHKMGCVLVVCSGRPRAMMPSAVERMRVMDYYLCANGAKVYDASGSVLFSCDMTREDVKRLMETVEPFGARWNLHSEGRSWIERKNVSYMMRSDIRSKIKRLVSLSPRHIRSLFLSAFHQLVGERGKRVVGSILPVLASHERFDKVGCSFPSSEACAEAVRAIDALGGFEVARVWERELEITAAGVTKGTTTDWLLEHLGEERERSVAFGDSTNDAPLVGHVGRFVAVGNADDKLKELADEVCAPLAEDGVARWLEEQMDEVTAR